MSFTLQAVLAARLGTSAQVDAYFVVVGFVVFLADIVIGVVSFAVLPTLVGLRVSHGPARTFGAGLVLALCGGVLAVALALAAGLGAANVAVLLAPGAEPPTLDTIARLLRTFVGGFACYTVALLLGVLLQARDRFATTALVPMLPALGSLLLAFAGPADGMAHRLALGFTAGAVAALVLQASWVVSGWRRDGAVRPELAAGARDLARNLHSVPWVAVAFGCALLLPMLQRGWASTQGPGSVAALGYAMQLLAIPSALLVMPIATVLLPRLTELVRGGAHAAFSRLLADSALLIALASLLLSALLAGLAGPIVDVLLQRGQFSPEDAAVTAGTLRALAIGLVGLSGSNVCMRALCAVGDFRTPALVWVVTFVAFLGMQALLSPLGVVGLGLAYALAYLLNAALYVRALLRRVPEASVGAVAPVAARLVVAAAAAAAISYSAQALWRSALASAGVHETLLVAMGGIAVGLAAGVAAFGGVLLVLRGDEARLVASYAHRLRQGAGA